MWVLLVQAVIAMKAGDMNSCAGRLLRARRDADAYQDARYTRWIEDVPRGTLCLLLGEKRVVYSSFDIEWYNVVLPSGITCWVVAERFEVVS